MKKALSIMLAVAAILSTLILASCGGKKDSKTLSVAMECALSLIHI